MKASQLCIAVCIAASLSASCQGSTTCGPVDDADTEKIPTFWCSVVVSATAGSNCISTIEESIVIPWSSGEIFRHIPIQESQRLQQIVAHVSSEGQLKNVSYSVRETSTVTNRVIHVLLPKQKSSLTVTLSYVVLQGIHLFQACDFLKFPSVTPATGKSLMLMKWLMGGQTVKLVQRYTVRFSLPRDSSFSFVDSKVGTPDRFEVDTNITTTDSSKGVIVSHSGNSTGVKPGQMAFYMRFELSAGWAQCPNIRSCLTEKRQLAEKMRSGLRKTLALAFGVGAAVVLLVLGITLLACWGSKAKAAAAASVKDPDLPDSLRHFAYDTGDAGGPSSSEKWKEWAEEQPVSSTEARQINAIELSPKNRK